MQAVIALSELINLRTGPGQRLFVLRDDLGRPPVAPCFEPVLINDEEEERTEQAQGNQVRPEIAVPDALIEQQGAAFLKAFAVVLAGRIDALQGEIEETILGL